MCFEIVQKLPKIDINWTNRGNEMDQNSSKMISKTDQNRLKVTPNKTKSDLKLI